MATNDHPVPRVSKAHSDLANEVKKASGDRTTPSVQDAARTLAVAKIAAYVERTVASAPELSPEQRQRLADLLMAVK